MKKTVLLLFFITFSVQLFSQKFVIVPNGIRSESDTTKNYVIVNFPDKNAQQIYSLVKKYIAKTSLHQPRIFLADIPNNFLRTKSYTDNIAHYKTPIGNTINLDGEFITTFEFKDKKMKVTVTDLYLPNNGATPIKIKSTLTHPRIFNTDGTEAKLWLGTRASLEDFLNSKLNILINSVNEKQEEW